MINQWFKLRMVVKKRKKGWKVSPYRRRGRKLGLRASTCLTSSLVVMLVLRTVSPSLKTRQWITKPHRDSCQESTSTISKTTRVNKWYPAATSAWTRSEDPSIGTSAQMRCWVPGASASTRARRIWSCMRVLMNNSVFSNRKKGFWVRKSWRRLEKTSLNSDLMLNIIN